MMTKASRGLVLMLGTLAVGGLAVCQSATPAAVAPQSAEGAASTLSNEELRTVLADLANAHDDKIKLSWWVSTPFRPVDPPFKPFFENMGIQNKALLAELQAWAKSHNVDITYHEGTDFFGRAQTVMESRQEKLVRSDNKTDFQRDILLQMFTDYDWRLSELKTLLPALKDPALKAYAEKALAMYQSGGTEIQSLLKHYKFEQ